MNDLTVLHGDNTDLLTTLAPRSVQCVVTSPPYYGLRDYGLPPTAWPEIAYQPMPGLPPVVIPAQETCLGLESTPEAYTAHLVHVFRLVREVLSDDGVCWLNLGDSYARSGGEQGGCHRATMHMEGVQRRMLKPPPALREKNLVGIPWRVAFALQADGWYLRSDVIWHKPNAMPESIKDRPTKDHEYVFLLAKSERYYFDAAAIAEPAAQSTQDRAHLGKRPITPRQQERQDLGMHGKSDTLQVFDRATRNKRTVWRISTTPLREAHYAPMPEALAEPCILSGSRPGDTVLDPFGGTGTTARQAIAYGRKAISMDLNPDYIKIHDKRTATIQYGLEVA